MIKKLRAKFIKITMISVFMVLFILMGAINIMNYRSTDTQATEKLNMLIQNNGEFPERETGNPADINSKGSGSYSSSDKNTSDTSVPPAPDNSDSNFFIWGGSVFQDRAMKEMPFSTRYFTVIMKSNGQAKSANTDHIASVSNASAISYAKELSADDKKTGYIDDYKYTVTKINNKMTYLFVDCSREMSSFRSFLYVSIAISLLGLACVFLLVYFISSFAVRPITESYAKQKRFITDASHEIKTPLAIIRANTEVMELENGENEWIRSNKHQIERLSSLTEKLVFLTRMDEDNAPLMNMADFSISDAVSDTISAYESMSKTKGISIKCDITEGINYHGDESRIRQLISLMMDNAMKYSSDHGYVNISLKNDRMKRVLITIENSVDSIEKGNHDELFERFYRSDKSRNSKTGGFGIGLSVCEAIVTAHKGHIHAESADCNSIRFIVSL